MKPVLCSEMSRLSSPFYFLPFLSKVSQTCRVANEPSLTSVALPDLCCFSAFQSRQFVKSLSATLREQTESNKWLLPLKAGGLWQQVDVVGESLLTEGLMFKLRLFALIHPAEVSLSKTLNHQWLQGRWSVTLAFDFPEEGAEEKHKGFPCGDQ